MKIYRKMKFYTEKLQIGDQIKVNLKEFGKFTATVQKVQDDGYLFMFDECVAKHVMNEDGTNKGGYSESDLCRWINEELLPAFPRKIRDRMSYISIPSYGQMFGHDEFYDTRIEQDYDEQFELMKNIKNRISTYNNEPILTHLRNRVEPSDYHFAAVNAYGGAVSSSASYADIGVRPIFFLKKEGVSNVEKVSG